jgi:hypothetical protein
MYSQKRVRDGQARAAAEGGNSGDELGKSKRLHQIIVTAGVQTGDTVFDPAERGKKQHRHVTVSGAKGADQPQPVEPRDHSVDD